MEIPADPLDCGQQLVENIEELERHAAGERVPAEGAAVHARLDRGGGLLVGDDEAERQTAGDGLGRHHDVGQDHRRGALVGEVGSRPSDAALRFIGDQQRVVAVGQLARFDNELVGERIDAALALDQLQDDPGGPVAERRFERGKSFAGTNLTPGISGSKSCRYLGWPVIESAPMVRP